MRRRRSMRVIVERPQDRTRTAACRLRNVLVYVVRRVLWSVPVILVALLVTFALMRGIGGTPFHPSESEVIPIPVQHELEDYYHLDRPWPAQFATYVWHIVRFDFGPTLSYRDVSVDTTIRKQVPVSLELAALSGAVAIVLGFALGIAAAVRRGKLVDLALTTLATIFLAVPVFLFASVGRDYLVDDWHLVGVGWTTWQTRFLPILVLALAPAGYIARLVRAGVVETLSEDYVRFARAKGLRPHRVLVFHVLPNSLLPFLSAAVPVLALLVTSAFFVEPLFEVPGAAAAFIDSAERRDYPVVMGLTAVLAVLVVYAVLVADVLAAALDVRLREAGR